MAGTQRTVMREAKSWAVDKRTGGLLSSGTGTLKAGWRVAVCLQGPFLGCGQLTELQPVRLGCRSLSAEAH